MQVKVIDTIHQFDNLRSVWDDVYSSDLNATVFVSWAWLRGWIETINDPWLVLCTRPDKMSPYVGFLPLFLRNVGKSKYHSFRELYMGGNPASDHTGFVCIPAHEENAIKSLAAYVQHRLKWDWFHMADVFDPRLNLFLESFSTKGFDIQESDFSTCPWLSCPYLTLPETWDEYLEVTLSRNGRKNIRRSLKNMDKLPNFHITDYQNGDFESNVVTLCQLAWGPQPEVISDKVRQVLPRFRLCSEEASLWLKIFWDGKTPISALAGFIDHQKKTFSAYNTGYDSRYSKLSPGMAIFAYSIRDAIQNGYKVYDFLRGGEDFKFQSYGAEERFNRNVIITRNSFWIKARKIKKRLKSQKAKISKEVSEIHRNLRRFGVLKAGSDCFIRIVNSFIYLKIFRCLKLTPETLNPLFLKPNPKYRFEILAIDDLLTLKNKREDWIPMPQIAASFTKGDACLKIYDGNRLANYSWYSVHPTMVTTELEVTFNNKDYVYRYKGFTYPDCRGQQVNGIGYAKALQEYSDKGIKGLLNIIESNNFRSLKSAYRTGWKDIGQVYVFKAAGKYLIFQRGELERYNLEIKPKNER